jgi:hypothetical protein
VACAVVGQALAQGVDKHVPARQKASKPPLTAVSVLPQHAALPISPPKSDPRKIIFVGGKSSLNPQPIPPGDPAGNPPK